MGPSWSRGRVINLPLRSRDLYSDLFLLRLFYFHATNQSVLLLYTWVKRTQPYLRKTSIASAQTKFGPTNRDVEC